MYCWDDEGLVVNFVGWLVLGYCFDFGEEMDVIGVVLVGVGEG